MASGAVAPPPPLAGARRGFGGRGVLHRRLAATPMKDEPVVSTGSGKEEMVTDSLYVARKASVPGLSSSLPDKIAVVPTPLHPAQPSDLRFNRLQPSIEESDCKYKRFFGCYVTREAIVDEEYWIAAWLRAEHCYEDQSSDRYVESFKRKFASQEFHALKKRCSKQVGEKYICFVAVKNDDIKRTVLNSVVGTLDVCVRHPLHGEKFPTEPGKSPFYCRIYQPDLPKFAYLTNVCVAKYARRQGIASNMLLLAIDAARLSGAESIYIHVHKDNLPARRLYDQIGFKCLFGEWRGIFGWTFDLHALLFKSLKEQIIRSFRWVPFVLADSCSEKSAAMVHVKLDGAVQPLPLTSVYHKLIPVEQNPYTLFQTIVGNGYPIALLDEEKILPIGKEITAIGLCQVNNQNVEIISCPEIPFFLTELTKGEMEAELASSAKTLFWISVALGTVSVGLLGHAIYRCWERVKLRREARQAQERFHQADDADDTGGNDSANDEPGEMGDGQLCVICLRKRRKAAFVPCGHLVCCCNCAKRVELMNEPLCPMCRQEIQYMIRIYDS